MLQQAFHFLLLAKFFARFANNIAGDLLDPLSLFGMQGLLAV
jgi:hypothetical protein